tara:strand:+ start:5666 stop:6580 length:915 start_codon:yes stop_codon:yes gene_type:complete
MVTKKLNTLVDDIYKKLSVLGKGKSLNLSEESIEQFGESMKEVLRHWSTPTPRSTETLRMSNIGRPNRQLWYDMKTEQQAQEIPPSTFIKFLYGHMLEEVVLLLVKLAGHTVSDEQKNVKIKGIEGHMDCVIDGEVIDVKTASGYAFKKFKDGTLAEDDTFGYMSQLAGYEAGHGTSNGGFLAMNKESGELALYIPEELDKPNIETKIDTVKKSLKKSAPPELCYKPIPDGSSGNMKLPRGCFFCRHKLECHKDSNNGKGLRVFKYSKGLSYLTQVVKEPRVDEITNEFKKRKTNKKKSKTVNA